MAGEPMKPATNALPGWLYRSCGVPTCWRMPSLMTATRSPMVMASVWSWVTYSVVMPRRRCSEAIWVRVDTRSLASRFDSGSSMRNTCGSRTMARPMATRWRWPPDSALGLRSRYWVRSSRFGRLVDPLADLVLRDAGDLQCEAHVVPDRHVRVERVVLEHHRDVAVLGRQLGDVAVADVDRAGGDVLEPGEHAQRGRLAAAGGTDQDEELPVLDLRSSSLTAGTVEPGYRREALSKVTVAMGVETNPSPAGTCRTIRVKWEPCCRNTTA